MKICVFICSFEALDTHLNSLSPERYHSEQNIHFLEICMGTLEPKKMGSIMKFISSTVKTFAASSYYQCTR